MIAADFVVVVAGVAISGLLGWFFFGPKKGRQAELVGQVLCTTDLRTHRLQTAVRSRDLRP